MTTQESSVEEEILELLSDGDNVSQKAITDNSSFSQGYISRTLVKMEDRGLVSRVPDGRSKEVQLAVDQSQIDVPSGHNRESKQRLEEIRELREPQEDGGSEEIEFDEDVLEQPEEPPDQEEVEGIRRDQAYHLLSTSRRRDVIKYLDEIESESASIRELAEKIAAVENDKDVGEINSKERKRVYIPLTQQHMDKLYESAVLENERYQVWPGEHFDIMKELVRDSSNPSGEDTVYIGGEIPAEDAFEILENSRRRDVIRYFLDNPSPNNTGSEDPIDQISVADMARQVATVEYEKDIQDITRTERNRVFVSLNACHLGTLDEYDIVDYNKDKNVLQPGNNIHVLSEFVADSFNNPDEYLTTEDVTGEA